MVSYNLFIGSFDSSFLARHGGYCGSHHQVCGRVLELTWRGL